MCFLEKVPVTDSPGRAAGKAGVEAGNGLGTAKERLSGWPSENRQEARRKEMGTWMEGQEDMKQTQIHLTQWTGIKYQMRKHADPATARW